MDAGSCSSAATLNIWVRSTTLMRMAGVREGENSTRLWFTTGCPQCSSLGLVLAQAERFVRGPFSRRNRQKPEAEYFTATLPTSFTGCGRWVLRCDLR